MDTAVVQGSDSKRINPSADQFEVSDSVAGLASGQSADEGVGAQRTSESIELDATASKAAADNPIDSALSARKGTPAIRA